MPTVPRLKRSVLSDCDPRVQFRIVKTVPPAEHFPFAVKVNQACTSWWGPQCQFPSQMIFCFRLDLTTVITSHPSLPKLLGLVSESMATLVSKSAVLVSESAVDLNC